MKRLLLVVITLIFSTCLYGEIVYMKDGQVLRGSIVYEDKHIIKVKTKYHVRKVRHAHIKRILYGERDMEPIYILRKDGKIIKGFLVDQDSAKVIFRKKKDSVEEQIILKTDIRQMSSEEILPLYPDIIVRAGMFLPINSGGSELSAAPMITAGAGMNFAMIKNMRVVFEAGYVRSESGTNEGQYFQIVPLTMSALYSLPFPYIRNRITKRTRLVPKLGIGIVMIDFEDGEGQHSTGYDFIAVAGAGVVCEVIEKTIYAGLWCEYNFMVEKEAMLHSISLSFGLSYRY